MADSEGNLPAAGVEKTPAAQLPPEMDVNLNDDKPPQTGEFAGATLELGAGGGGETEVEFKGPGSEGLHRDRPYSASMISRKSTLSTKSKTSLSPSVNVTEFSTKQMFSYKVITSIFCQ